MPFRCCPSGQLECDDRLQRRHRRVFCTFKNELFHNIIVKFVVLETFSQAQHQSDAVVSAIQLQSRIATMGFWKWPSHLPHSYWTISQLGTLSQGINTKWVIFIKLNYQSKHNIVDWQQKMFAEKERNLCNRLAWPFWRNQVPILYLTRSGFSQQVNGESSNIQLSGVAGPKITLISFSGFQESSLRQMQPRPRRQCKMFWAIRNVTFSHN